MISSKNILFYLFWHSQIYTMYYDHTDYLLLSTFQSWWLPFFAVGPSVSTAFVSDLQAVRLPVWAWAGNYSLEFVELRCCYYIPKESNTPSLAFFNCQYLLSEERELMSLLLINDEMLNNWISCLYCTGINTCYLWFQFLYHIQSKWFHSILLLLISFIPSALPLKIFFRLWRG